MKEPQRNNENDWHEDCNETQQHHWHFVCFQLKRRGEPATYKGLLKKVFVQSSSAKSQGDWAPNDFKRRVTEIYFLDLQKGGAKHAVLLKSHI